MGRASLGRKEEKEFRCLHARLSCPLDIQVENLRVRVTCKSGSHWSWARGEHLGVISRSVVFKTQEGVR